MAKEPITILALGREVATLESRLLQQLQRGGEVMVLGRTSDAVTAVRMCRDRRPRAVLVFVETSVQVQLVSTLLGSVGVPVVALTRTTTLGVEAMAAGAAETLPLESDAGRVSVALRLMADLQTVTRTLPATRPTPQLESEPTTKPLVLVGTSTGGPPALVQLLAVLGSDFTPPVVIVQHMPDDYGETFTQWLAAQSPLPVQLARPGIFPQPSQVYIAPSGANTSLGHGGVFLGRPRSTTGPCPSVDVLFESAARLQGFALCGVVMTGMGSDGARGLLAMRQAGGFTIVQDRASCVVYGMPAEALKLGAAEFALSPPSLGEQLRLWAKATHQATRHP